MAFSLLYFNGTGDYRRAIASVLHLCSISVKRLANAPFKGLNTLADLLSPLRGPNEEDFLVERLKWEMENASSLVEYEKCTTHLDHIQCHDEWKAELRSIESGYDPDEITTRITAMQEAVISQDPDEIQYLVRTSLSRDLGGLSMLRLYKHSWFGTKRLVDEYNNAVVVTIDTFAKLMMESDAPDVVVRNYRQSLKDTLKFYGRSALTLSGGAIMGMKHIGVTKCLWESELLPQIISGASAGSIVAAIICSSTDEEMAHTLKCFPSSNLAVFDPPDTRGKAWAVNRLANLFSTGSFFKPKHLEIVMKEWLSDLTFREAHNKTQRILNICVSGADNPEPRILNYITAPDVYIWSAVCASCAVPCVYPGATILEKDTIKKTPKPWMQYAAQKFVDGSLDHDIPMRKLAEVFNVNCFIVSQVNPHVRPALSSEEVFTGEQPTSEEHRIPLVDTVKDLARDEFLHYIQQMIDLGSPPGFWRWTSLLSQQYTGHINILPQINSHEYLSMMANPTPGFMLQATQDGERATWPKMCRIKNCVDIELALLQGIRDLNERLHFSPEARAARQLERSSSPRASHRGGSAQAMFLRRRSLSSHSSRGDDDEEGSAPRSRLGHRRNASLGNVRLESTTPMPPRSLASLSPQAGVDDRLGDGLLMTALPPRERE